MKNALLICICSYFLALPTSSFAGNDDELWNSLKNGGLVVLMRHASTTTGKGQGDPMLRDADCRKETNLSDAGKKEASMTGKLFVSHGVKIERVLTSPYCRTTETARLAFNKFEPAEFLSLLEALPQEQAEINSKILANTIGSYAGKGVLVLVTHDPNINAVSFESVGKGGFLVIKPIGGDEFEEIGKIKATR